MIEINHLIETIQHQCFMVSQDKGEYEKIIMVIILVLTTTACSSMKKNEE